MEPEKEKAEHPDREEDREKEREKDNREKDHGRPLPHHRSSAHQA